MFIARKRGKLPRGSLTKSKKNRIIKVNSSDFVISQITILTSCEVEDDYMIKPSSVPFINANGNSWKNEDIERTYHTFIGGHNFLEHDQNEKKSYGFIADATLKKRSLEDGGYVYDVDLLVATARRLTPDDSVAEKILKDKSAKFSMGCYSSSIQCSYCGNVSEQPTDDCVHLSNKLGSTFVTTSGGISEVSAIITPLRKGDDPDKPTGFIRFIEASIVRDPAYAGAVLGYILNIDDNRDIYFKIPESQFNRKSFNGIKHWAKKGLVKIIK